MANPKGNPQTLKPYRPTWRSGKTQTIRVPIAIADLVLEAARKIDQDMPNTDTSVKKEFKAIFEEIINLPSNRGGQIKIAVSELAKLLGFEMKKTGKGWKITDTSD